MQMTRRPLILISNDDGYKAKGINELIRFLRPLADLVVVAPDGPRSGASSFITMDRDLVIRKVREEEGLRVYSVDGSPADCVKLAFYSEALGDRIPDAVIAGINHGDNASTNVHYSGTMGAAREGCLKGIPSIGFSLCDFDPDADFSALEPWIRMITGKVLERGLPDLVCLNVNFPKAAEFKGMRICRQSAGYWIEEFRPVGPRDGGMSYRIGGTFIDTNLDDVRTDHHALQEGYVAITPTNCDVSVEADSEPIKEILGL